MEKKKAGRKPLGNSPLTSAQKMRRQRAKQAFLIESAKDSGYISSIVLLNEKQLLAWGELEHAICNGKTTPITQEKISSWIFYALKKFLNEAAEDHDLKIPKQDDWPTDDQGLSLIAQSAQLKFNKWEMEFLNESDNKI